MNGVVFLGNDFVLSPFIVDPSRVKLPLTLIMQGIFACFAF